MKNLILILIFCGLLTGKTFGQSGDLEVVSIDPEVTTVLKGQTVDLILVVNQNGPDDLPVGTARVSIAISETIINWVLPITITDDCGNVWTVQTPNPTATTPQISIRNNNAVLANNAGCTIRIPVMGIAVGTANLTVASTVLGGMASDPNGTNQGATGVVEVLPALPVTLTSFTVVKENRNSMLSWATTMETNSDHFEIQHSLNGKNWNKIGIVASHGESASLKNYSFTDSEPEDGENLYRLRMVDKDQTFAYSRIQGVKFEGVGKDLSVYPNPAADLVYIRDAANVGKISITDLKGTTVYQSNGLQHGEVSVRNLLAGVYVVKIVRKNGKETVQKIVVSR